MPNRPAVLQLTPDPSNKDLWFARLFDRAFTGDFQACLDFLRTSAKEIFAGELEARAVAQYADLRWRDLGSYAPRIEASFLTMSAVEFYAALYSGVGVNLAQYSFSSRINGDYPFVECDNDYGQPCDMFALALDECKAAYEARRKEVALGPRPEPL